LASYSYINTAFLETFQYYGIHEPGLYIWSTFVLIVLLIWEGNRLLEKWISGLKQIRVHPLLLFFGSSLILAAIAGWISFMMINYILPARELQVLAVEAKLCIAFGLRVNLFLHCLNGMIYFVNQSKQKELEAEALRTITSQARLQSIRNQVNPHFLFNNLNVLSTLVMTKNEEANTFIESFSSVYRYILNNQEKETVELREEIAFIEPYVFLLQKRYGTGFSISLDINPAYYTRHTIPVALQMLIENAIKHNVVSVHHPLTVRIFVNNDDELVVMNNVQLRTPDEPSSKTGLKNITERYKLIFGKDIMVNHTTNTFSVGLPLISIPAV
jgi:LytS/YehU family sensor histidine kinase